MRARSYVGLPALTFEKMMKKDMRQRMKREIRNMYTLRISLARFPMGQIT
jgi:hypothetical protein